MTADIIFVIIFMAMVGCMVWIYFSTVLDDLKKRSKNNKQIQRPTKRDSENKQNGEKPKGETGQTSKTSETSKKPSLVGQYVIEKKSTETGNTRIGKIVGLECGEKQKIFAVRFGDVEKKYEFPLAFEKGTLIFADVEIDINSIDIMQNSNDTETQNDTNDLPPLVIRDAFDSALPPYPPQPFWIEKTNDSASMGNTRKLKHLSHYGTNAQEIYLKACEVFGWNIGFKNQFVRGSFMYARRATLEGYSVWFLTHHVAIEGDKSGQYGAKWRNYIARDKIFEDWFVSRVPEDEFRSIYDSSCRLTFAKDKRGKYVYIGIFKPVSIDRYLLATGQEVLRKTFELVETEYSI